ncbi:unnamed protein product [Sympodiomycopsis kandeliae]
MEARAAAAMVLNIKISQCCLGPDNMMVSTCPVEILTLSLEDEQYLIAWSKEVLDKVTLSGRQTSRKVGDIQTWQDVYEVARQSYVGDGHFIDATGSRWPGHLCGLDRIDPRRGYDKANVRVLNRFCNLVRKEAKPDKSVYQWIQNVKTFAHTHHLLSLASGFSMQDFKPSKRFTALLKAENCKSWSLSSKTQTQLVSSKTQTHTVNWRRWRRS